jgi:hypothetical protein
MKGLLYFHLAVPPLFAMRRWGRAFHSYAPPLPTCIPTGAYPLHSLTDTTSLWVIENCQLSIVNCQLLIVNGPRLGLRKTYCEGLYRLAMICRTFSAC